MQPIAGQMAEDALEKPGGPGQIDVVRLLEAFDAGKKALAPAKDAGAMRPAAGSTPAGGCARA